MRILNLLLIFQMIWTPGLIYAESEQSQIAKLEAAIHNEMVQQSVLQSLYMAKPKEGPAKFGLANNGIPCMVLTASSGDNNFCEVSPSAYKYDNTTKFAVDSYLQKVVNPSVSRYRTDAIDSGNIELTNTATKGVSCLKDALRQKKDELEMRVTGIRELIAKIQLAKEEFKNGPQQKAKDFVNKMNNQLFEGKGINWKNHKTLNTPSCRAFHTKNDFQTIAQSGGLNNIIQNSEDSVRNANDFSRQQVQIQAGIEQALQASKRSIASDGLMSFIDSSSADSFSSKLGLQGEAQKVLATTSFKSKLQNLKDRYSSVKKDIDNSLKNSLGDSDDDKDIYDMILGAQSKNISNERLASNYNIWRNKKQSQCIYGVIEGDSSKSDLNEFQKNISNNIKSSDTNRSGNQTSVEKTFSNFIKLTFSRNNLSISQKINQIDNYIKKYPELSESVIRLGASYGGKGMNARWKPVELLKQMQATCNSRSKDPSFGPNGDISQNKSFTNVQAAVESVNNLKQEFDTRFYAELKTQLFSCPEKVNKNNLNCNASNMQVSGDFCFAHAQKCTVDTKQCFGAIQREFDVKKEATKKYIENFNLTARSLQETHTKLYNTALQITDSTSKQLSKLYPGATFKIPIDELKLDPINDLDTFGDTKNLQEKFETKIIDPMATFSNIDKKLKKILDAMDDQNKEILFPIENYVESEVKNNYKENGNFWIKQKAQCDAVRNAAAALATGEVPDQGDIPICLWPENWRTDAISSNETLGSLMVSAKNAVLHEGIYSDSKSQVPEYLKKQVNTDILPRIDSLAAMVETIETKITENTTTSTKKTSSDFETTCQSILMSLAEVGSSGNATTRLDNMKKILKEIKDVKGNTIEEYKVDFCKAPKTEAAISSVQRTLRLLIRDDLGRVYEQARDKNDFKQKIKDNCNIANSDGDKQYIYSNDNYYFNSSNASGQ
jgi:hypothetical protein